MEGDDGFGVQSIHSNSSSRKHAFNCKSVERTITLFWLGGRRLALRGYWLCSPDRHIHFSFVSRVKGSGPYASLGQYDTPYWNLVLFSDRGAQALTIVRCSNWSLCAPQSSWSEWNVAFLLMRKLDDRNDDNRAQ